MYDWVKGRGSITTYILALYDKEERYIGTVVRRRDSMYWCTIPFEVGERAQVIYRGTLLVSQVRLQEWYKKRRRSMKL